MAILTTDLEMRISGGASETDPNNALGGAMSTVAGGLVANDSLNNDMDDISGAEASSGIIIYHGYYWKNNHGSLPWLVPVMWIESQTSSGDTDVAIAIADEDVSTTIETIADENTAPVGPTFTAPANKAAGFSCGAISGGDMASGAYRGWWAKYTVNSSASAALDSYTVKAEGDTNP